LFPDVSTKQISAHIKVTTEAIKMFVEALNFNEVPISENVLIPELFSQLLTFKDAQMIDGLKFVRMKAWSCGPLRMFRSYSRSNQAIQSNEVTRLRRTEEPKKALIDSASLLLLLHLMMYFLVLLMPNKCNKSFKVSL